MEIKMQMDNNEREDDKKCNKQQDNENTKILAYEKIPFGHWGIISRHNLREEILNECRSNYGSEYGQISGLNLEDLIRFIENKGRDNNSNPISRVLGKVPKKRWDFTLSTEIRLNSNESQVVLPDKYEGRFALISAIRAARPDEYSEKEGAKKEENIKKLEVEPVEPAEVFARIIQGKDYDITVSKDEEEAENPFSTLPKKEQISGYAAVTMINRFPAYIRVIDEEIKPYLESKVNDGYTKLSYGINLLTIPTKYYEKIEDTSVEDLHSMFESMKTAINYVKREAEKRGIKYIPVYPFFNIGKKTGSSLKRLHSQTYIDLNQDGHGSTMEDILKAFEEQHKKHRCKFCNLPNHELSNYLIYENENFVVYATRAPIRNYDTKIIPKRHVEDMLMLTHEEFMSLSEAIKKVFIALNTLGADADRNILIYQRPFGYDSFFHTFLQILPFENVGGIEMMDDSRVVRVDPSNFAEEMRKAIRCN